MPKDLFGTTTWSPGFIVLEQQYGCRDVMRKRSIFCTDILRTRGGVVAEWLTARTPDLEVRGSGHARRVVSLDRELYYTLSLVTQVYKWIPTTYCWGVTLRWTSIPSRED